MASNLRSPIFWRPSKSDSDLSEFLSIFLSYKIVEPKAKQ